MNIAILRHSGSQQNYVFSLPDGVKVKKGTMVKVQTSYGEKYGVLVHDSVEADGDALSYILQSCGANLPLKPVLAVMEERPIESTTQRVKRQLEDDYAVGYSVYPVKFRAQRKDNAETMESPCVYTTSDGKMYLGTTDTATVINVHDTTGNIYKMVSVLSPLFVEIEPYTLEWSVEK